MKRQEKRFGSERLVLTVLLFIFYAKREEKRLIFNFAKHLSWIYCLQTNFVATLILSASRATR